MDYIYLTIAILCEIIATSFLKASDGFTRLIPTVIVLVGYVITFYCLSIALRTLPIGMVYATWSGVGIALLSLIGYFVYHQKLDWIAILGILLIMTGVVILNLFSKSKVH